MRRCRSTSCGGLIGGARLHLEVLSLPRLALGAAEDAVLRHLARVVVVRLLVHQSHLGVLAPLLALLLRLGARHLLHVHRREVVDVDGAHHHREDEVRVLLVLQVEHERAEPRLVVLRHRQAAAAELLEHLVLALVRHPRRVRVELVQHLNVRRDALLEALLQLEAALVARVVARRQQHPRRRRRRARARAARARRLDRERRAAASASPRASPPAPPARAPARARVPAARAPPPPSRRLRRASSE